MTITDEALLAQFMKATVAQKIEIFLRALTDGRLGGSGAAIETGMEMLEVLYEETAVAPHPPFADLITQVRAHAPELYEVEAGTLLEWQITRALRDGRTADLPSLTQELAQHAAEFPAELLAAAEKLAYYGQLAPLAAMLHDAWPHIQAADFEETAVEEYVVQAMNYLIMDYVTTHPVPGQDIPHLLALLDPFAEIDADELRDYVAELSGQQQRTWQPDDFAVPPQDSKNITIPLTVENNLTHLLREFMHAAPQDGVPISRAALAYWPLHEYLLARLQESARAYQPKRKPESRVARKSYGLSYLCPTPISLAQFLAEKLESALPRHYPAAALVAVLPAWLRFLQQRGLITPAQQKQALHGLQELLPELHDFWSDMPTDSGLLASLEAWQ